MTKEERKLLLKDLCGRLLYGVKYCRDSWNFEWDQEMPVVEVLEDIDKEGYINYRKVYKVEDIKPYLRPMSSMTEDEKAEYNRAADRDLDRMADKVGRKLQGDEKLDETLTPYYEHIDWLLEHHFDYRGLIGMGLALEAPEGMYNFK